MAFPTALPESLRSRLPAGVSLFPRPEKRRWVFAYEAREGGRPQKVIPKEVVLATAAVEYVLAWLRSSEIDPAANLDRRRVEGPTVADCGKRWLELCEKDPAVAPATLAGYSTHLRKYIAPHLGDLAIVELAPPRLRKWIREDLAGVGARTVQHVVSSATVMVDCAMAEGWISVSGVDDWTKRAVNPLRSPAVRSVIPVAEDQEPVVVEIGIVQALLTSPKVPLERRARYALAFTSGMRDGEIAGVLLSRLHLDDAIPTVEIVQAVALKGGKGKGGWAKPKAPKTRGSVRTLPLHPAAVAALREWLAVGWVVLVGRQPTGEDYLFPRPDGGPSRPRSAEFIQNDLKAAGLPTEARGGAVEFKSARSSFLTWLDEAGVDERIRKRLAGHVAKDVTEKHYTRRELEQLAAAVATIALVWEAGTLPLVVPLGTTAEAKASESLAPPARIGLATFGLGRRPRSKPRGAKISADASPEPPRGAPAIGLAGNVGRRKRPRIGAGEASVVPPDLARARAGLVGLRSAWDPLDAFLELGDDPEGR